MPTKVVRMSSLPKASTVSRTARLLSSSDVASPWMAATLEPNSASSAHLSGLSSNTPTEAPSRTNSSTTPLPIPEPPPTARATLPSSHPMLVASLLVLDLGTERRGEELGKDLRRLPGEALELQGIEENLAVLLRGGDLQPLPVAGSD